MLFIARTRLCSCGPGSFEGAEPGPCWTSAPRELRRTPDPMDGRYTLATLTDEGWTKVTHTAPGHVEEVRRLVFDPLTKAQSRQLREIDQRILHAIDPDDRSLDD
jgi:hypothetical protein